MWVNRETYRKNLLDIARLKSDSANVEQLKEDTARLNKVIQLKDRAFNMLKEQVFFNKQVVDTLTKIKDQQAAIIKDQDEAIRQKDNTIAQLNKHKVSGFKRVVEVLAGVGVGVIIGMFK